MAAPLYQGTSPLFEAGGASGDSALVSGAAPAMPPPVPSAGYNVNVISPHDGKTYSVDASMVQQAQAQGYRVEESSAEAARKWTAANAGLGGAAKAAFLEFGDALTFGAYKPLIGAAAKAGIIDPFALAKWEALKHEHAAAAFAGTAAGFGTQMLVGGGLLEGIGKAGAATEAAVLGTKTAGAAEAAVEGMAGAEMAYRTAAMGGSAAEAASAAARAPGFLRTVAAGAARLGVENAAMTAPKAFAEAITGDPDRAAETLLYGSALGAGFGAGFGALGYLGKRLGGGIAAKLAGKGPAPGEPGSIAAAEAEKVAIPGVDTPKGWLARKADELANMQTFRAMANNNASLKKIIKDEGIQASEVGLFARANGIGKRIGEGAEEYAARVGAFVDETGAQIGAFWRQPALEGKTFATDKALTRIEGMLADLRKNPAYKDIADALESKWVGAFREGAAANDGKLGFEVAQSWRAGLDDLAYREARIESPILRELKQVRRIFNDEIVSQAEAAAKDAAPGFLADLRALNTKYRYGSAIRGGVDDYVKRDATNRVFSPTDNLWGAAAMAGGAAIGGGPVAMLAGAAGAVAHHVIRTEGNAALAALAEGVATGRGLRVLETSFAGHYDKLQRIPIALKAMGEGRRLPPMATEPAALNVITHLLASDDGPTRIDKPSDSIKFADGLAKLSANPVEMSRRLAQMSSAISADAPTVAQAAQAKATQVASFILAARPASPEVMSPFAREVWKPSDTQLRDFHVKVKTALDPYEAIRALEDKTLSAAHIDALSATAPKLYQEFVRRVADFAATPEASPIPYAYRLKLSMLTGAPLDRSVANLMGYQETFSGPDLAKQAEQGGAAMDVAKNTGTDVGRVSG